MKHTVGRVTIVSRRAIVAAIALSVLGSGVAATPAAGESPPKIPKNVQIKDPAGDANFLNAQGEDLPVDDDNPTPADLSVPDILSVWFTHDVKTISVHIQTEAPPPAAEAAYLFAVTVNPESADSCLYFKAYVDGPTWVGGSDSTNVIDCHPAGIAPAQDIGGQLEIHELPDGTGIMTMMFPRLADRAFADGEVLKSPLARSSHVTGVSNAVSGVFNTAYVDRTKRGRKYVIANRSG